MSAYKRICALAIIMALELFVASCVGGDNRATAQTETMAISASTTIATTAAATTIATEEPTDVLTEAPIELPVESPMEAAPTAFNVGFFWHTFEDSYLASVRDAIETRLDELPDVSYGMYDCYNDQVSQMQMIESALACGMDLLIVSIVNTSSDEAAQKICDMAKSQDVPIIFFNREVSDSVVNSYDKCCYVGTDADEAYYALGEAIAEYLLIDDNLAKCDLDGDMEISYIMFIGEWANRFPFPYCILEANRLIEDSGYKLVPSPANETHTVMDNTISNNYLYANWSKTQAVSLMQAALLQHRLDDGAIELIYAANDDMALGAIEAMNEAGYNTGEAGAGYIPVFGIDATADAQEAIAAGKMTGTVMQDSKGLVECVALLVANVAGGRELMSDTGWFTVIDPGVDKIRVPCVSISF